SFTFRAVRLPDPVTGVTLFYRPAQWRRAVAAFERWSRHLPDQVAAILTFMVMPEQGGMGDEPWLMLRCVFVGLYVAVVITVLGRLRRAAPPDDPTAGPVTWPEWQSSKDVLFPNRSRGFWRNVAFTRTDEDALDAFLSIARQLPGRGTG